MSNNRVKISSIVQNLVPEYVKESYPLAVEFLRQYYTSLDSEGGVLDLLQNIDKYVDVDHLTSSVSQTTLLEEVLFSDSSITVVSTDGFPNNWGLIKINDEIICYEKKTNTQFLNCYRGFSGITSYKSQDNPEELVFTSTDIQEHIPNDVVYNLNANLLKEFFKKLKVLIIPGFEDKELYSEINQSLFVKQSGDFYRSKGTDSSFKILFGALFGKPVEVIRPRDYLIEPSSAQYRITKDLIVEAIEGNPEDLVNATLYQDADGFLDNSRGAITNVEKINRGDKTYFVLSLDYDYNKDINVAGSVFGDFNIHPKTRIINEINEQSITIDVDSTIGFPESGELVIDLDNDTTFIVTYTSKSINQFYGCSGIVTSVPSETEVKLNVFAYGYANSQMVKVRITGVISDLVIPNTRYYTKDETVNISNLGYRSVDNNRLDNWLYNFSVIYDIKSITLVDESNFSYKVEVFDEPSFNLGDSVTIVSNAGEIQSQVLVGQSSVVSLEDKTSFIISGQGELDETLRYRIRKNLLKANFRNYSFLSEYNSNVQNTYFDPNDESVYVASTSLPSYNQTQLDTISGEINIDGTFSGEILNVGTHYFYTGDSVTYNSELNSVDLESGIYFVERVSSTQIKLARSKNSLYNRIYLQFSGLVKGTLNLTSFTGDFFFNKTLTAHNIVRKIPPTPEKGSQKIKTNSGYIGIFNNGVELLNYKSNDVVYFGGIESVSVTSGGTDYDVISPPVITISDDIGVGSTVYAAVKGELSEIQLINSGFDYIDHPKIIIEGGNGVGAQAEANLVSIDHLVQFNSTSSGINTTTNIITTIDSHKFRQYEEVLYFSDEQTPIGGLVSGSSYFIEVLSTNTVKLYYSEVEASTQTNAVQLTSFGEGKHVLKARNKKNKIQSISVKSPGEGYKNRKCVISTSGINTAINVFNIPNHLFIDKDIVNYSTTGVPVGGMSTTTEYYVRVIDDDHVRLCSINTTGNQDVNYQNNNFVNLSDVGSGEHIINHKPITVSVVGKTGVSSYSTNESSGVLQPIFSGEIYSIFVHNKGSGYGCETILNYNKQPQFLIDTGSKAQVKPIVSNGGIVDVIVLNSGTNYSSPPELIITGDGSGAILVPIINSGILESVKIISSGSGYINNQTSIEVVARGSGVNLFANIKQWRINLVSRGIESGQIASDDGIIYDDLKGSNFLQYSHAYAPRKLREIVLAEKISDGEIFYKSDLQNDYNTLLYHSPIIGWAYDGNPIYGPYGYSTPNGGSIRALESGYELIPDPNRPTTSIYPIGFFIEDYSFTNSGDLDECNGRFCITPDYPKGIYAYFAIVDTNSIEDVGVFNGYRKPIFPYVIGNTFNSTPVEFNFLPTSNQTEIDFNKTNWLRNTRYYNLFDDNSEYPFITNPNKIKSQVSKIKSTNKGKVDNINIVSGGDNYSITDRIIFDDSLTSGRNANASISAIKGVPVTSISVESTEITDVEVLPFNNSFIGFATTPHQFDSGDLVTVSTNYGYNQAQSVVVPLNTLNLIAKVEPSAITGVVTHFSVIGNLDQFTIKENDVYEINEEQIKILRVDRSNSRIRVERNLNGTIGVSTHSSGSILIEKPNKLILNVGVNTNYNYKLNREYYFNPTESVGLGNSYGVGIAHTLYFISPGVGATVLTIPTRSLYIPSHEIETGDLLTYKTNQGSPISISTDGATNNVLTDGTNLYAIKLSNDLVGLTIERASLNSIGEISGVSNSNIGLLYFTGIGTGTNHSFRTNYSGNISASISQNIVTVNTEIDSNLSINDLVSIDCKSGITTTIKIKYNDYNRRLTAGEYYFVSGDVNIADNSITIINHNLTQGQRIIHTSSNPCGGLVDQKIYYVQYVNKNKIKLTNLPYKFNQLNVEIVNISTSSFGNILPINPPIEVYKNSIVEFDLSDPSLSFTENSLTYSAFDFKLYKNPSLTEEFISTQTTQEFEVQKTGQIGVDGDAKVILTINDNIPGILYYNLIPINVKFIPSIKSEIETDNLVDSNNKIVLSDSGYNGTHLVQISDTNQFKYFVSTVPESESYNSITSKITYTTTSPNVLGGISSVRMISSGYSYDTLPVVSVSSTTGSGAIMFSTSNNIGSVKSVNIEDIGFDYSSDLTLKPYVNFPSIISVESLSSFDYIGISSIGRNYSVSPDLIVIDSFTDKIVEDVDISYEIGDSEVTILQNSSGFYNVIPRIVPINNTNGIGIRNIDFNIVNKDVIVTLASSFSDPENFPFVVGDKVLIENISVNETSGVTGYNSQDYNYKLFELTSIDSNISGIAVTVAYNLADTINELDLPGTFNSINSYGRIIAEKEFPIFNVQLKKNEFFDGETVISGEVSGVVENWDKLNGRLTVASADNFIPGSIIRGVSSLSRGIVNQTISYNSYYNISPSSIVIKGWLTETGFLNNSLQRLIDSDYYQYFSYSLKSEIDISNWDETVSNLNHTAGFKRFGDLQVNSKSDTFSGISTEQNSGAFSAINYVTSIVSPDCFYDFDLVGENNITLSNKIYSNEVYFNSRVIQNYIESIGNRVLTVDDLSPQFNNVPSDKIFSIIETDRLNNFRSKKYITLVQDRRYTEERQLLLVNLIHNDSFSFINQYANVDTWGNLGSFDYSIIGDEGNLEFYPIKNQINDYNVNYVYYSITDVISGIGSTAIGDGFIINSDYNTIPIGISTAYPIVGINSLYNKGKVLIQVSDIDNTYFEFNELNYISDGTNVTFIDYANMSTGTISVYSSSGIGTYSAQISGSKINILLDPNVGLANTYKVSSITIGLANTSFNGIGTETFSNAQIKTFTTDISSSAIPGITTIASYSSSTYGGAYYIVGIQDITNNTLQFSEVVVCNGMSTVSYVEYGSIETISRIGEIGVSTSLNAINLEFTPSPNIETQVKVYQHTIGNTNSALDDLTIDLNNANIQEGYNFYYGTFNSINKDFNLTSEGKNIFQRTFNPQSSDLDFTDSTIKIPQHYFVTGEKIIYDPGQFGDRIGIVTTNIAGIGITDKLPSTLYIVKDNISRVKVAVSSSHALASIPTTVDFITSGVGTEHNFTATQQNSKVLISIDNIIQTPVVSLATTTLLQSRISVFDDVFVCEDTSEFFGTELIKIDDEIMRLSIVGFGSTGAVLVQRPWFGTEIQEHEVGSLITKVDGDFNILKNTISFVEAPYGLTPQEDPSSLYDLDYTGIQTSAIFSGRVFMRSGEENSNNHTYSTNYVLDNISPTFTGITSDFTLTQEQSNLVGIVTSQAIILVNQVLQQPKRDSVIPIEGNYDISESVGISSIQFNGYAPYEDYDVNSGTLPKGGVIVSISSTEGYGYQPLVSAGGTAVVSIAGTISAISIGNTGSGYRAQRKYDIQTVTSGVVGIGSTIITLVNNNSLFSILSLANTGNNCTVSIGTYLPQTIINGITTNTITISGAGNTTNIIPNNVPVIVTINNSPMGIINVGVANSSVGIATVTNIGFATIYQGHINSVNITNPGFGYSTTNVPVVLFEQPLSYSDLPLIYSSTSSIGIGTGARINVVVGQGSSVIEFEIANYGYAYNKKEILTIETGGLYGLPLNTTLPFSEFNIRIDKTYKDEFAGWVIGDIQVIDPIDTLFDGIKTVFPIEIDGERVTIRAKTGSDIDVEATLIITINDVLQIPGQGFVFDGGSTIRFTNAPKPGDTSKILFYRGTSGVDTKFTDILELVKNGDRLTINSDNIQTQESQRIIKEILSTDIAETNLYGGNGINEDVALLRPVTLCHQRNDFFAGGQEVTKDREIYEYSFTPILRLLKTIDPTSTDIFVDNCRPYLSSELDSINSITLTPNISWVGAAASAIVSIAGTVSSIIINEGGDGYTVPPIVSISYPIGFGTTVAALGVASVSSGIVTMITVTSPGSFYTTTNPPQVLIESPKTKNININNIIYEGDFGTITGIAATSITGIAPIGLELDFYIPENSYLRDESIVGSAITISGIQTGYYFVIDNSNIGNSPVSYDAFSIAVGFGSTYLDGVYEVAQVSIASSTIPGVGATFVQRVVVKVSDNSFSGITTNYYGDFSWGRISGFSGAISTEIYSFY